MGREEGVTGIPTRQFLHTVPPGGGGPDLGHAPGPGPGPGQGPGQGQGQGPDPGQRGDAHPHVVHPRAQAQNLGQGLDLPGHEIGGDIHVDSLEVGIGDADLTVAQDHVLHHATAE